MKKFDLSDIDIERLSNHIFPEAEYRIIRILSIVEGGGLLCKLRYRNTHRNILIYPAYYFKRENEYWASFDEINVLFVARGEHAYYSMEKAKELGIISICNFLECLYNSNVNLYVPKLVNNTNI